MKIKIILQLIFSYGYNRYSIHTAVWINNSQEVPAELVEITNEIKNKTHEKK